MLLVLNISWPLADIISYFSMSSVDLHPLPVGTFEVDWPSLHQLIGGMPSPLSVLSFKSWSKWLFDLVGGLLFRLGGAVFFSKSSFWGLKYWRFELGGIWSFGGTITYDGGISNPSRNHGWGYYRLLTKRSKDLYWYLVHLYYTAMEIVIRHPLYSTHILYNNFSRKTPTPPGIRAAI